MYARVFSSTGKKPHVAPYSGAMFAIVARSGKDNSAIPAPKNSTNFPTTPCSLSNSTILRVMSVAVTPGFSEPFNLKPTTSGASM